eukprot:TRINITY_DN747_c0_g1_i2.p1 TRINITY_DN747_c0_g1~~TRINITY_DN747_c0_g1_i2.p1  ORF type:complete len:221 (+),score=83.91 TRINITY_DN747_c0_g1_i2:19-681(+)
MNAKQWYQRRVHGMLKGGRMTLDMRDMVQFNEVCDLLENCKLFDPTKEPEKPKPKPKPVEAAPVVTEAEPMEVDEKKVENTGATTDCAETAADGADSSAAAPTPAAMETEEEVEAWDDDMDDLLARIKAEKKAKGLDTLNMSELAGMSKEEKIKLLEEKRAKFRAQKHKNAQAEAIENQRKQREAIKAQADMQRKREAHENKMAIEFKKKEKVPTAWPLV